MIIQTSFPVKPVFIFSRDISIRSSSGKTSVNALYGACCTLQKISRLLTPKIGKLSLKAIYRQNAALPPIPVQLSRAVPLFLRHIFSLPVKKAARRLLFIESLIRCRWKESVRCCHSAAAEAENPDDRLPSSALLPEHRWNDT